jgi:tRNA modification GTPase
VIGGSDIPFSVHVATAAGVSGIAIVELYGNDSESVLADCFRGRSGSLPPPGRVRFGSIVDRAEQPIDDVLVASFGASTSWCGLSGWSVSCHGGKAILDRILDVFRQCGATLRRTDEMLELASGGENVDPLRFPAHRLFLDGLTERASRYFLAMHRGALVARARYLFERLCGGTADFEAGMAELTDMLDRAESAIRLGRPLRVLIAGAPNVGKSTLFNRLLGRDRVVVSPLAGTTRDLIEETVEISGYPVTFIDSAGIRAGEFLDSVERQGIEGIHRVPRDAVVYLSDSGEDLECGQFLAEVDTSRVQAVRSKADLDPASDLASEGNPSVAPVRVSAVTGTGLAELRECIRERWLGPAEIEELGPLPFTRALESRFRDLHGRLSNCGPTLDGVRQAFLECLGLHVVQCFTARDDPPTG